MFGTHVLHRGGLMALLTGSVLYAAAAGGAEPAPNTARFVAIAYRNIVDADPDPRLGSASTQRLAEQFDWLKTHGYQPVSLDDLMSARQGRPLPPKPVLLTFDDGFESFYTRAYPLLQAFHYPAVVGVTGSWMSAAPGTTVHYGQIDLPRTAFMSWNQVREVMRSGLVEVAAQSNDLHAGIAADPQGDLEPAVTSRRYDRTQNRYEDDAAYTQRLQQDVTAVSNLIRQETGRAPRAMMWPHGERNQAAIAVAAGLGMPITLTLDEGNGSVADLSEIPRHSVIGDPAIGEFTGLLSPAKPSQPLRSVRVVLDDIYDPIPAQVDQKLGMLVDRINRLQISAVFLEAFVEPRGSEPIREVYFPNRVLPMRADIFNHVAWQLRTRTGVTVYATMPILGFDGTRGAASAAARPEQLATDLYEDLARTANFGGLLFDEDRTRPGAADTLDNLTKQIAERVKRFRGPIKTARTISASSTDFDAGSNEFSKRLAGYVGDYDYAIIATTIPDGAGGATPNVRKWLSTLVAAVKVHDSALQHSAFSLQTADGRTAPTAAVLANAMELLREQGVRNFGYHPDDFVRNRPDANSLRAVISLQPAPAR